MAKVPAQKLTLRDLFREAELLGREFADHLVRGFAPKVAALARSIRPSANGPIKQDVNQRTLQNQVQIAIDSNQFSQQIFRRFHEVGEAIDSKIHQIITKG